MPTPPAGRDWPAQAADTIEKVVGAIRDKTAVPLATVARGLVYGVLAAVMGVTVLILATIGLVRALDAYLPGQVWSAHGLLGGIFIAGGGLLLRKATPRATSKPTTRGARDR